MITLHPYSADETPLQCLPRTVFAKRAYFPAVLSMAFAPPANGACMSCEERLVEAEAAYHALQTGTKVQTLNFEGQSITYTRADRGDLHKYVLSLRAQCGGSSALSGCGSGCGCSSCRPNAGRALGVALV